MANLKKVRPRIFAVLGVLLVLDAAMVVYLVSPLRARPTERQQELARAIKELKLKQTESAPLSGMHQKLKLAQTQLDAFYKQRFAMSESEIATEIGRLATSSGVQISGADYKQETVPLPGAQMVDIDAELQGQYLNDVKFINALERDKMFFLLQSIQLEEQKESGMVRIHLAVQTFLRS